MICDDALLSLILSFILSLISIIMNNYYNKQNNDNNNDNIHNIIMTIIVTIWSLLCILNKHSKHIRKAYDKPMDSAANKNVGGTYAKT